MKFRRRDKDEPPEQPIGTDLVRVVGPLAQDSPPPRPKYDYADMVWRCRCGATGTSRESAVAHIARALGRCQPDEIREYVPKEVYETEYEAQFSESTELEASGTWIVVQMSTQTGEGEMAYAAHRLTAHVVKADSGLKAIQTHYEDRVRRKNEGERDVEDGRYVAIDFFTGHRAEALIEAEWRANVDVAAGSHQ